MGAVRALLALLCLGSLCAAALAWRNIRRLGRLADQPDGPLDRWPRVSLVIAARDEADTIGPALASRLSDDYPNLDVIVVDDRSTDETAAIVERAAAADPRVRLVRVAALPEGWVGKVNALARGVAQADGEYLLLSDADLHSRPGTLKRAVAFCEAGGADFLPVLPEFVSRSALVNMTWTVFMRALMLMIDPEAVRDPGSRAALGSGSFGLVRRSAFDRTPGFEWLRLETADDMALAMMLKRSGARLEPMNGRGCTRVDLYPSVRHLLAGTEKNGGTTAGSPWRFTLGVAAFVAIDYSPLVALAVGPGWLRAVGGVTAVLTTALNVAILGTISGIWVPALAWPLGTALFAVTTLRATWLARARGGVTWRGTFYPVKDVTAARRFEF